MKTEAVAIRGTAYSLGSTVQAALGEGAVVDGHIDSIPRTMP